MYVCMYVRTYVDQTSMLCKLYAKQRYLVLMQTIAGLVLASLQVYVYEVRVSTRQIPVLPLMFPSWWVILWQNLWILLISGPHPCIHFLLTLFFYKNLLSLGLSTWDLFSPVAFICHLLFCCCQRNQLFIVPHISYLCQLSGSTFISFLWPGLRFSSLFIY
jgi:hypothetical protein